ncbi:Hypothetical protein ORPV_217, partial [Orpheovirus IHUMI-LCC2]
LILILNIEIGEKLRMSYINFLTYYNNRSHNEIDLQLLKDQLVVYSKSQNEYETSINKLLLALQSNVSMYGIKNIIQEELNSQYCDFLTNLEKCDFNNFGECMECYPHCLLSRYKDIINLISNRIEKYKEQSETLTSNQLSALKRYVGRITLIERRKFNTVVITKEVENNNNEDIEVDNNINWETGGLWSPGPPVNTTSFPTKKKEIAEDKRSKIKSDVLSQALFYTLDELNKNTLTSNITSVLLNLDAVISEVMTDEEREEDKETLSKITVALYTVGWKFPGFDSEPDGKLVRQTFSNIL